MLLLQNLLRFFQDHIIRVMYICLQFRALRVASMKQVIDSIER